jgi:hypothetical protein
MLQGLVRVIAAQSSAQHVTIHAASKTKGSLAATPWEALL